MIASSPVIAPPASASANATRSLGARLPAYDLLSLAGSGACSEVWLVQVRATGALYALKAIRDDAPNRRIAATLLENEALVARGVSSAHVCRLADAQLTGPAPHLLLEWLSGETLAMRLRRLKFLGCREALWIARQITRGLADLYAAGLMHGDVKPSNVFLCANGLVKLIDLGFARPAGGPSGEIDFSLLVGTPEYLAPESLVPGHRQGFAKDLYALGVTMYRMLTGVAPFEGHTLAEIMRLQQQLHPPRVRALAPHVPSEVEEVVHRLLSKQPLRRGGNPLELVQELVGLEIATLDEGQDSGVGHQGAG